MATRPRMPLARSRSTRCLPPVRSTTTSGEKLSSLAGVVFEDFSANAASNNNGAFDSGERPIAGATLTLTGTDSLGNAVNLSVQTDAAGRYSFGSICLPPLAGNAYTVTQTQPAGYIDGKHVAGNAASAGDAECGQSGVGDRDQCRPGRDRLRLRRARQRRHQRQGVPGPQR